MSQNNITALSYVHAINSNIRSICVLIIMFNHFQCNILMYYENFSTGHKCRDNLCPPLSSLMVDISIEAYGQTFQTEQSFPIDTMLKVHNIIMT